MRERYDVTSSSSFVPSPLRRVSEASILNEKYKRSVFHAVKHRTSSEHSSEDHGRLLRVRWKFRNFDSFDPIHLNKESWNHERRVRLESGTNRGV